MMKPSYYAEEYGVQVIRPLAFVEEEEYCSLCQSFGIARDKIGLSL